MRLRPASARSSRASSGFPSNASKHARSSDGSLANGYAPRSIASGAKPGSEARKRPSQIETARGGSDAGGGPYRHVT